MHTAMFAVVLPVAALIVTVNSGPFGDFEVPSLELQDHLIS